MTIQPVPATSGSAPAPGAQLGGGRYTLDEVVRPTPFGTLYRATDATSGNPVSVHLLDPALLDDPAVLDALSASVDAAAQLDHKNLAQVVEFAAEGSAVYVVSEFLDGHTLRELVERKRSTGQGAFGIKGAHNIVVHLCSALEALHGSQAHGAVSLDSVVVNKAGRVRLADAGLVPLLPAAAAAGKLGVSAAPEVVAGQPPAVASDLYGVGAVLYELVVGAPPVSGCQRPSQAVPGLSNLVDTFVATCMQPQPERRPRSAAQVKAAADKALGTVTAASAAQAGPSQAAAQPQRPSLAQSIATPAAVPEGALADAIANDYERWLISKGKLDYGPFTLGDIVEQIQKDDILPGHVLVDNDTGDRIPVEEHPLLIDLVDAARQRRDDERRARAEVETVKQEKRRGATLYLVIAAVVLGIGGGAYALVKALGSDDGDDKASLAALDEGSLEAKISFPSAEEQKQRKAQRRRGKKRGGGGVARGTWDDSLDLDMAAEGGGTERLDDSQINPVIQRHGRQLGRCLTSTGSRSASIDFIVVGSGKVSQVRVNGQTSGALYGCVRKAMQSMKFPSFDGVRTKANFDMAL